MMCIDRARSIHYAYRSLVNEVPVTLPVRTTDIYRIWMTLAPRRWPVAYCAVPLGPLCLFIDALNGTDYVAVNDSRPVISEWERMWKEPAVV